jgi:transcriptional regulator GlxA family with amidase domain
MLAHMLEFQGQFDASRADGLTNPAACLIHRAMNQVQSSGQPFAVTVLVLPESSMMSVAATIDPLRACNRVSQAERISWRIVTADGNAVTMSNGLALAPHGRLAPDLCGDLLVIVAAFNHARHAAPGLIARLKKLAPRFQAVAGVESGPWLMARMGLLDDRAATTHWEDFEDFANAWPETELRMQRYVIDGATMTAGGASPALDLMLHLIRQRFGHRIALEVASVFIYDEAHAGGDAQPAISLGRLAQAEPRIAEAIRVMERAIDRPVPTGMIARRAGVSARMLEMLFRRHLGESPAAYYAKLRLQAARRLVVDTSLPMQQIAVRTGFSSLSAFSRSFSRHAGESATALRRRVRSA